MGAGLEIDHKLARELGMTPEEVVNGNLNLAQQERHGRAMAVPPSPPAKDGPRPVTPPKRALMPPRGVIRTLPSSPAPVKRRSADDGDLDGDLDDDDEQDPGLLQRRRLRQTPLTMNPPSPFIRRPSEIAPKPPSTKRSSFLSAVSRDRRIKYGRGKYAMVELVPQPSDDPDDPLNWPLWKKELNFGALLMMVALVGVMKTAFISVNSVLAVTYSVSYTAAAALTGVPLMLSAFAGLVALSVSRVWGRRPAYLVATSLIFIGAFWNVNVASSYAQCMAARIFQGLGWGVFDALVIVSLHDTYFEHERALHVAMYYGISVATTWGAPLLGGVVSQSAQGFELQYVIIDSFLAVAALLMALAAPETAFDRAYTSAQTPATGLTSKSMPLLLRRKPVSIAAAKAYLWTMKPYVYRGSVDFPTFLQAPRAMFAPTNGLLILVSILPFSALWAFVSSLSLLFSPLPFLLESASVGALLTGPWLFATLVAVGFALWPAWRTSFVQNHNLIAIAGGSVLSLVGVLAFGLHLSLAMDSDPSDSFQFALDGTAASRVSLGAVSFALGLLAAGAFLLDATVRPLIKRSTNFTSSNMGVALRCTADMDGAVTLWRSLFAGVFVMALPNAVWYWDGLKGASIGIAVAQAVLAAAVGGAWWYFDENIRRLDGRVLGVVDLEILKKSGSFFDLD